MSGRALRRGLTNLSRAKFRATVTKECPRWAVHGQGPGEWHAYLYYFEGWARYRYVVLESVRTFETWAEAMAYVEFAALVSDVEAEVN